MTYRILDIESTGLPSETKNGESTGMMEIAWVDLSVEGIITPKASMLVDSGIPCSIPARAIHHISDEMVAGEINPSEACALLARGDHIFLCAHNTDYERVYVGSGVAPGTDVERSWICTYKSALRIWPDAPGHKLMELRYFLKLDDEEDFDPNLATPPHRAAADAYVCAHLLRRLLKECTVEQMLKWSSGPALLYMCHLKKHKGKPWHQVVKDDRPYVQWAADSIEDRNIRATAKYWLKKTGTS